MVAKERKRLMDFAVLTVKKFFYLKNHAQN